MHTSSIYSSARIEQHDEDFASAVLEGFDRTDKTIPSRFLYDARGSELFEEITHLEEYYPTRTEIRLLEKHAGEIAAFAGSDVVLTEFGSGSSRKTGYLIEALYRLHSYVPIDISLSALKYARKELSGKFPDLKIAPLHADFTHPIELPEHIGSNYHLGFFPGSTIGNFTPSDAVKFLQSAREILGNESGLVIGVDLQKSEDILIPAYDDARGVTADFNLNLLARINRELDGDIDLSAFRHRAIYNRTHHRIEMHLESLKNQTVQIMDREFTFSRGETIHTENSHKYSVHGFSELAEAAGWSRLKYWTDDANLFSIHYLLPRKH